MSGDSLVRPVAFFLPGAMSSNVDHRISETDTLQQNVVSDVRESNVTSGKVIDISVQGFAHPSRKSRAGPEPELHD